LIVRNSILSESTGGAQAALEITAGTVDLGTMDSPGGNEFVVNGPGEFIRNTGPNPVPALGNAWKVSGALLADPYLIEDAVFHALDAGGGGLVTYVTGNVFVTPASGSIQRAVDAVAPGDTVNVAAGAYAGYDAGAKLLSVRFEGGPSLSQQTDPL